MEVDRKKLIEAATKDTASLRRFLSGVMHSLVSRPDFDEEVTLRAVDLVVEAVTEFNIRQRKTL